MHPITPLPPQPVKPVMRQTWRRLTFLHWPYVPAVIRPLLPKTLELDTFDNKAWLSLVPFEIYSAIPHFPETNLRTYVVGPDGSRAVWFFSLDADRLLAVIGARVAYHLPYFWSSMQVTQQNNLIRYQSRRRLSPNYATDIRIRPLDLFQPADIDHFLTARFRLYAQSKNRLYYSQIEHPPWPLAHAEVLDLKETLTQAAGLPPPQGQPIVHYSADLTVNIGPSRRNLWVTG